METDTVYAALPDPTPSNPIFDPINTEELLTSQLLDAFCVSVRRRLNEGVTLPYGFKDDGILCRYVSHEQIVIPQALKERVLHIHHYSRLTGHPGDRKLYQSTRKDMYWLCLLYTSPSPRDA